MRPLAPTLLALLALLGCAPKDQNLVRRPLSPVSSGGWVRLPLDSGAQRALPDLWIGDADGISAPFMLEREGLWQPHRLELVDLLLGTDPAGRPSAQFSLRFPEGWRVREREHLELDLELLGEAPWVAQVRVERRLEGGEFLLLERESPLHVFDLGPSGRRTHLCIPWDGREYRLSLVATTGAPPRFRGLGVTARTRPEELQSDQVLTPPAALATRDGAETWTLTLPGSERIVGADLVLKPPVAPITARFRAASGPDGAWAPLGAVGLAWNLPALNSRGTRLPLGPVLADRLECALPPGARLDALRLLVRRDVLLFPAEAGRTLYLHTGGRVKPAPGNLMALPDSSRAVFAREPLRLGPPEADPQGLPLGAPERTRPLLPWLTGLLVGVLGLMGWRLLKGEPG
jgi:hypothetical protein